MGVGVVVYVGVEWDVDYGDVGVWYVFDVG